MITREELIRSKEYWLAQLQARLYQKVEEYLKENRMSKKEFAEKLGVSKGYVSQILNGNFDHKLSKFIELSLMIDKVPLVKFEDIDKMIRSDKQGKSKASHPAILHEFREPDTPYGRKEDQDIKE